MTGHIGATIYDLVYEFKRINNCFKRMGYTMGFMQQSSCLVINPITVYSYDFLFSFMLVG